MWKKDTLHCLSYSVFFALTFQMLLFPSVKVRKVNPNFDLSSVHEFWPVMETLLQDKEPTPEQWRRLFDSTGHNTLRREFKDDVFKSYFRAAYMPGRRQERRNMLEKAKKADNWFRRWFPGSELAALEWTRQHRDLVEAEARSLETYPYTRLATGEALKFLPEEKASSWPRVAFVIFNDSRGYDPVIMSLNHLAQKKADLPEEMKSRLRKGKLTENYPLVVYFGHEFFHYFRGLKEEFTYPQENDPDYAWVWVMDQIENEGIADQINVKALYGPNGPLAGGKAAAAEMKGRERAPKEIRELNDLLTVMAAHPDWAYYLGLQARKSITRSGHVAGYYMTNLILAQFPRQELIKVARNPFRFFFLYQRAAEKDGGAPRFSKEALRMIRRLERKTVNRNIAEPPDGPD